MSSLIFNGVDNLVLITSFVNNTTKFYFFALLSIARNICASLIFRRDERGVLWGVDRDDIVREALPNPKTREKL